MQSSVRGTTRGTSRLSSPITPLEHSPYPSAMTSGKSLSMPFSRWSTKSSIAWRSMARSLSGVSCSPCGIQVMSTVWGLRAA